ncbi:MAG: DUF4340 domain-containing protein [Cyclobacteriaceae bacterium]
MQETKNKRRFILLAIQTVTILVLFWWIQPENRLDVDQDIFQVEDLNRIGKVEIVSDTSAVSLEFNGAQWRVNEKYDADGDMIRVLFATLQQARPKRAVATPRQDSIYSHLEKSGVKVSLFEGTELRKQFFAGGNKAKTQAFFADVSSNEVYVMTIPGYRVYVSGILELPESGWRNKFVFGFNWRNFKSLKTEFLQSPSENFTVSMGRDQFGIEGVAQSDTAILNTFLDEVSLLTVDEYVNEPGLKDSLLQTRPQMEILITDIANRTYRLRLFDQGQSSQVLGILQDSQAAIFSRRKIQPLLKPKSFFRKK